MKKYLGTLIAIILLTSVSCQEKTDIEKEKTAILKMLDDEIKLFIAGDKEGLSTIHVQDVLDTRFDGTKIYSGWSEIETLLQGYIERNKNDTISKNVRNVKENIILKVTGNTAWLICDNIWKWEENGESKEAGNYQISFLEKINGQWKFSFNAFVNNGTSPE